MFGGLRQQGGADAEMFTLGWSTSIADADFGPRLMYTTSAIVPAGRTSPVPRFQDTPPEYDRNAMAPPVARRTAVSAVTLPFPSMLMRAPLPLEAMFPVTVTVPPVDTTSRLESIDPWISIASRARTRARAARIVPPATAIVVPERRVTVLAGPGSAIEATRP